MERRKIDKVALASVIRELDGLTNEQRADLLALLNERKSFGLVWEEKEEEAQELLREQLPVLKEVPEKRLTDGGADAPNHVLIEADNLHAVTALMYTHAGQFDVIYIDPPYNTGAKNWIYNNDYVDKDDEYRHSKWISMMNNRLVIAKKLLKPKGVLILAIDENELATIKILLEELFNISYDIDCVTVVQNPRGIQGKNFSYTNEFAIFVIPRGEKIIGNRKIPNDQIDWRNLRDNGGESLRTDAKNCFYSIITDGTNILGFGDVLDDDIHPNQVEIVDGLYHIYPIDVKKIERKWRYARQSVDKVKENLRVRKVRGHYEIEIGKDFGTYRTVWEDARYDANEYGKKLINSIIPNCSFDYPKSIYNVFDCLYAVVSDKKNALILDFFAGSGTTLHATMMLNEEDGGHRQCILVTNNENNICEEVTYERNKRVINGYTTPKGVEVEGLHHNNLRYYKVDFVPRDNSIAGKRKLMEASTDLICIKHDVYQEQERFGSLKLRPSIARYFEEKGKQILIIYKTEAIEYFVNEIAQMPEGTNVLTYIFSTNNYALEADFEEVADKVTLCALPAAIYNAYLKVLPKKKMADTEEEAENAEPTNNEEEQQ